MDRPTGSGQHHEDRAGVNALIRGIDELRNDHLPVLTVMCTNRLVALDPAIRRRAAAIFELGRPTDEQRRALLTRAFSGTAISAENMALIVKLTGPINGRPYGATYSDLRHRYIPTVVLDALGRGPLTGARLVEHAQNFEPTRPFDQSDAP